MRSRDQECGPTERCNIDDENAQLERDISAGRKEKDTFNITQIRCSKLTWAQSHRLPGGALRGQTQPFPIPAATPIPATASQWTRSRFAVSYRLVILSSLPHGLSLLTTICYNNQIMRCLQTVRVTTFPDGTHTDVPQANTAAPISQVLPVVQNRHERPKFPAIALHRPVSRERDHMRSYCVTHIQLSGLAYGWLSLYAADQPRFAVHHSHVRSQFRARLF